MTAYQLLPDLGEADLARLRADIAERGVMVPIEVDENGAILDGHHRQRIASELGIVCPRVVRRGMAEHEKRLHAVALNVVRRQLTDAQQTILGRLIEPDVAEAARLRMAEAGAKAAPGKPGTTDPPLLRERTRDEVAQRVGLGSGRTYERKSKVVDRAKAAAPELYERMDRGEATVKDAARELRQLTKATRVAAIAAVPAAALPVEQTFSVLYVDPPWRYEYAADGARKVENHYPTMSLDEIKAVDVPAADDAVLFCWATSPKLREALEVLDAWGFDYRTGMVWIKDRIGMGYYVRQQHELLLIAKRGELPTPDATDRPSSVIHAPRGEHSAKPARVYELIEAMYPHYQRCEMFQRQPRPGWVGWGNQVEVAS